MRCPFCECSFPLTWARYLGAPAGAGAGLVARRLLAGRRLGDRWSNKRRSDRPDAARRRMAQAREAGAGRMTATEAQALRGYWRPGCSSCVKVKEFLAQLGVE